MMGLDVAARPAVVLDRKQVELKFLRAINTLIALPDVFGPSPLRGGWPPYIRDYMDAYEPDVKEKERFEPTPADVSAFLDVLSWGRGLDEVAHRILLGKARGYSFRMMGEFLDVSHETVRCKYEDAIDEIWTAAHAEKVGH